MLFGSLQVARVHGVQRMIAEGVTLTLWRTGNYRQGMAMSLHSQGSTDPI
jgi:hypothetical protein